MSEIKANVVVEKSFEHESRFSKDWKEGDFEKFFSEEGEYLDRLSNIVCDKGENGEGFTITYTITVVKKK